MSDSRVEALTSVAELVGAVLIALAFFLWWLPAGLFVAGVELVGIGWLLAPTPPGRRR
jgi:hypothetical protein